MTEENEGLDGYNTSAEAYNAIKPMEQGIFDIVMDAFENRDDDSR